MKAACFIFVLLAMVGFSFRTVPMPSPRLNSDASSAIKSIAIQSNILTRDDKINAKCKVERLEYGPVRANETLWSIAKKTRPNKRVGIQHMSEAIYKLNPLGFAGNINTLLIGVKLILPNDVDLLDMGFDNGANKDVSNQEASACIDMSPLQMEEDGYTSSHFDEKSTAIYRSAQTATNDIAKPREREVDVNLYSKILMIVVSTLMFLCILWVGFVFLKKKYKCNIQPKNVISSPSFLVDGSRMVQDVSMRYDFGPPSDKEIESIAPRYIATPIKNNFFSGTPDTLYVFDKDYIYLADAIDISRTEEMHVLCAEEPHASSGEPLVARESKIVMDIKNKNINTVQVDADRRLDCIDESIIKNIEPDHCKALSNITKQGILKFKVGSFFWMLFMPVLGAMCHVAWGYFSISKMGDLYTYSTLTELPFVRVEHRGVNVFEQGGAANAYMNEYLNEESADIDHEIDGSKIEHVNEISGPQSKSSKISRPIPSRRFQELPLEERKKLFPTFSYSSHTYSESPENRKVIINGDVFRQGDLVFDKFTLLEIEREMIIFYVNNERVSVPALFDWHAQ